MPDAIRIVIETLNFTLAKALTCGPDCPLPRCRTAFRSSESFLRFFHPRPSARLFSLATLLVSLPLLASLAGHAAAEGVRPQPTATVTYAGANSRITLNVPAGLKGKDVVFLFSTLDGTAKGGRQCGYRDPDVITLDFNSSIVIRKLDINTDTIELPVELCDGSVGKTFHVVWDTSNYLGQDQEGNPYPGEDSHPFDITAPNCSQRAHCKTEISIVGSTPSVNLSVSGSGHVTEGGSLTITATRSEANTSGSALVIPIQVKAAGTTAQQGDYTVASSISIAGGTTTGTTEFTATDDGADEPPETVVVEFGTLPDGTVAGSGDEVEITITDNDATQVTLSGATEDVTEGADRTFTVMLGRGLVGGEELAVPLTFVGDATRGTDYTTACPGTLPAGVACTNLDSGEAMLTFTGPSSGTTATSVTLTLSAAMDSVTETGGETVDIGLGTLSSDSGTGLGGGASGTDNLDTFRINDPGTTPVVSVSGGSAVTEGGSAVFTLTASPAPTGSITVNVDVTQVGTFAATGQTGTKTVTIGANGMATLTVATDDDGIDEPHGSIIATVRDGSGYSTHGEDGSASVTVNDNDPVASFASGSSSQDEDDGTRVIDIRVDLDPAPQSAITLLYAVDGTATPGDDFTIANSGTVVADPGDDHVNIPVRIIDDSTPDGGETVVLTLAEGTGYSVGAPSSHTVTITNDNDTGGGGGPQQTAPPEETGDSATDLPTVTVMPGPSPVDEGTAAGFTVRRSGSTASALTVLLTVSEDGTEGQDFVAPEDEGGREVEIPVGFATASYVVPTVDDDVPGPDGTVTVALRGSGDEYTVGNPTRASVTVRDDDGLPEASFASVATRTSEGDGAVDVAVLLDPAPTVPLTLRYAVSGTASPGTGTDGDFVIAGSGSVVVPEGAARATVRIALRDDREDEGDETVILALAEGEGYVLADGGITRHVLTVADDDRTSAAAADDDARPAFLTRLGRTVGLQAVDAITDRLAADRAPGFAGTLSGRWLPKHREPAIENGIDEARRFLAGPDPEDVGTGEIVAGTAFALTRDAADDLSVAVWGRGTRSAFGGTEGGMALDGAVTGLMFGTDWTRGDHLFGVMLSRSRGEVRYGLGSGQIETGLTSVVPYAARYVDGRIRAWGAAGLGSGDVVLVPKGGNPVSADVRWHMAAAGLSGALDAARTPGGAGLGWTADALWTRTAADAAAGLRATSGETRRLRIGLDSRWVYSATIWMRMRDNQDENLGVAAGRSVSAHWDDCKGFLPVPTGRLGSGCISG